MLRLPLVPFFISLLLAPPAPAATIHRCVVNGVPSFQDSPCPKTSNLTKTDNPRDQIKASKRSTLLVQKQDLIRELRYLTLQRQQLTAGIDKSSFSQEAIETNITRQAELERDYAQREARLKFQILTIEERLAAIDER